MAMFAIMKDNKVENIIVCDSKAFAEEVTGFTCIEYTHENPARIGLGYSNGVFEQPAIEVTND